MGTGTSTTRAASTLTPREYAQLRAMLEQQQDFRVEQLAALFRPGQPGRFGSAVDEVTASLVEGARAALRDVRAALYRMATGSYGLCTRCDDPIGRERLEILPQVAMCMTCQRDVTTSVTPDAAGRGAGGVVVEAAGNGRAEG